MTKNIIHIGTLIILTACGGTSVNTFTSCLPMPMSLNEKVTYKISHKSKKDTTTITTLSAVVLNEDSEKFTIGFMDQEKQRPNYTVYKNCKYQIKSNRKLTRDEGFIIFNSSLGKEKDIQNNNGLDSIPPSSSDCITQSMPLKIPAGNFLVEKCTYYYPRESEIKTNTQYYIVAVKVPVYGKVKEVIEYNDGSSINAELIEWNDL